MSKKRIALIGAGNIGGVLAEQIAIRELGDVVLFDVVEGLPQGKALDILEGLPVVGSNAKITGTNNYKDIEGSNLVIITAGLARKPGMSRDDLLIKNLGIMKDVARNVAQHAKNAFVIVVSNPLDAMVYTFQKISKFPTHKVCGMAGVLDSSRFRAFVAMELGCPIQDVYAVVLGGHGDTMVPLPRLCTVKGKPLPEILPKEKIEQIVERTKNAGGEVVALLKTGSAFVSPALSALAMAESYLKNQKKELPCAAYLNGEYGVKGYILGVPAVIGAGGIEKIVELKLNPDEMALFQQSLTHVQNLVRQCDSLS
ncbi:MAG: malate dehydrogenase [Deltaproteobacteria bacterium]|nr:malate dehydrogenase [Deltaproteobacteria bacterium]